MVVGIMTAEERLRSLEKAARAFIDGSSTEYMAGGYVEITADEKEWKLFVAAMEKRTQ